MASPSAPDNMLSGICCSAGIALARARIIVDTLPDIDLTPLDPALVDREVECFQAARTTSMQQMAALCARWEQTAQRDILESHLLLLEDEEFESEVLSLIQQSRLCAAAAIRQVIDQYAAMMSTLDDPYLRERAADYRDIGDRLVRNTLGIEPFDPSAFNEDTILVVSDLTPSQTAQLDLIHIKGLILEQGGPTSHCAIMARALGLPAVVGARDATRRIQEGDWIALDTIHNQIWIRPDEAQRASVLEAQTSYQQHLAWLASLQTLPAETLDGHGVALCANISSASEAADALAQGAEGIGLYRTEFLFMACASLPDEAFQYQAYRTALEALDGRPVMIRTLDIGGDKALPYLDIPAEMNPFLGWRAIRIFFDRPDIMRTQLRALLRASAHGKLRILFPMIISVEEIRLLKQEVEQLKQMLRSERIPFDDRVELGIMIETPAAAVMATQLANEVDFFSIGTNDLTQYTLAVDRGNAKIACLYDPLSPAVLSLIQHVIDASHAAGKWTGMCGELAGDEHAVALLVGMGLDELSMSVSLLPAVKARIRTLQFDQARQLAAGVTQCATRAEVESLMRSIAGDMRLYQFALKVPAFIPEMGSVNATGGHAV